MRLQVVAREVFGVLTSGDPTQVRSLRAPDSALGPMFEPGYVEVVLAQRSADAQGHERITSEWSTFAHGQFAGWCARRVGPATADLPGLTDDVEAIGELVLAGRDAAGEWAGVVHDLVRIPEGWRLVRWSVDPPRRNHFELEQWSCDFGSRR